MTTFRMMIAATLAAGVATTCWAGPVGQETGLNLVNNGSFENTSSLAGSGFTTSGFVAEGFDYFLDTVAGHAQSGTHSFAGGAIGGFGYLTQSIATTPGTSYNIHFWLANLTGFTTGTAFQVLWGGQVVYSVTDIAGSAYHEIVIDPPALGTSTTLSFGLQDDSFFLNLDNISVRAVLPTAGTVPEPAELALLAAGLLAAGHARRSRASKIRPAVSRSVQPASGSASSSRRCLQ